MTRSRRWFALQPARTTFRISDSRSLAASPSRTGSGTSATGDVDAVVDEVVGLATGSGAQLLVEAGIAEPDPGDRAHRVFIDGTKLEIIDTQALPADVSDIGAPLHRLFVLGHRWALESAES